MLLILHLFCNAESAQPIFSIAVEMILRFCCYVFLIPLEVF